jgi:MFS family permease
LLKIIGPRYLLAGCALGWGIVTLCMAFIQNVGGLYTCRLLIGFFEAAIFPCIDVYIGMVYKKEERGQRAAIIFAFSAFSSAFGGLLAYGLTQINGPNGFQGWRWLFIVEGIITILIVVRNLPTNQHFTQLLTKLYSRCIGFYSPTMPGLLGS